MSIIGGRGKPEPVWNEYKETKTTLANKARAEKRVRDIRNTLEGRNKPTVASRAFSNKGRLAAISATGAAAGAALYASRRRHDLDKSAGIMSDSIKEHARVDAEFGGVAGGIAGTALGHLVYGKSPTLAGKARMLIGTGAGVAIGSLLGAVNGATTGVFTGTIDKARKDYE